MVLASVGVIGAATASIVGIRRARSKIGTIGAPPGKPPREELEIVEWTFPDLPFGEGRCLVITPMPTPNFERLPLLIALHGRGEAADNKMGAHAWIDMYGLPAAVAALRRSPLTADAFGGLVQPERLAMLSEDLSHHPFEGLVVACPWVPRDLGGAMYDDYASFLADRLIPKLKAEMPIVGTRATTGIDGVSLGGITALRMGMMRPDLFGVVAAMQPAIIDNPPEGHIRDAIISKLGGRRLRLMTSDEDVYKRAVMQTSQELKTANIAHELLVTPGKHNLDFCKGPGAIEMLLFHDRALRG